MRTGTAEYGQRKKADRTGDETAIACKLIPTRGAHRLFGVDRHAVDERYELVARQCETRVRGGERAADGGCGSACVYLRDLIAPAFESDPFGLGRACPIGDVVDFARE